MRDFIVLIYLDMLKMKNQIIEIFKSPLQFIKKAFGFLYFIVIGLFIYLANKLHGEYVKGVSEKASINISVILAIIALILILGILFNLFYDYTPSNFSLSDIQYLFPSALNNKIILLYSLIKSSIKGVFVSLTTIIFLILIAIAKLGVSLLSLLPLALGLFFIFMFFMSLGYLIFSIRVKFSLDKLFKNISYILMVSIGAFVLYIVYAFYLEDFNISNTLSNLYNSPLLQLPIVKSIVVIFKSILPKATEAILPHVMLLFTMAMLNFIIFISLKVEYYEAIAEKVEDKDAKIKEIKSGKYKAGKSQIDNNIKKINFSVRSKERNGVMALFWKNSVMRKRRSTPIKKYLLYALNIILGGGAAYLTYTSKEIVPIYVLGAGTVYVTLIFSAMTELYRELKTLYIYLIPGTAVAKILAASLDELLTLFYRILIMLLPAVLVSKENVGIGITVLLVTLTACAFLKLQSIIIVLMIPDKPTSPPILYMLYTMFIVGIPAAVGGVLYGFTSNMYLSLGLMELVLIAYIAIVLLISEALFNKIQY